MRKVRTLKAAKNKTYTVAGSKSNTLMTARVRMMHEVTDCAESQATD